MIFSLVTITEKLLGLELSASKEMAFVQCPMGALITNLKCTTTGDRNSALYVGYCKAHHSCIRKGLHRIME